MRYLRKAVFIVAIGIGILLLAVAGIAIYISSNEALLKRKLVAAIQKRTLGETAIGSISSSFLETFPFLSVRITDITLRDSAYPRHKTDLLKAEKLYLRASIFKLFSDAKLDRVIIEKGVIRIFKDSTGFDNTYIFQTADKEPDDDKKPDAGHYPDIEFRNMELNYTYPDRFKDHRILARRLIVELDHQKKILEINAHTNFFVYQAAFNTIKGGYLQKTNMQSDLQLFYDKSTRQLRFDRQIIQLNGDPFQISGQFSLDKSSPDFSLAISSKQASYKEIARILPDSISTKLLNYTVEGKFTAQASIRGKTTYRFKPRVLINMQLDKGKLATQQLALTQASFKGQFNNEVIRGMPRDDANSSISLYEVKGKLENIDIRADSMVLLDLKRPVLRTHIYTDVALKDINELSGSETMKFTTGRAIVDIHYIGSMVPNDSLPTTMNGSITIKNGGMTYLPRQFVMNHTNGKLQFRDNHLIVDQLRVNTGKTNLVMNGRADNFLSMLNVDPGKLLLIWNIYSPNLNLEDYKGFVTKRKGAAPKKSRALFSKTADRIDKMFMDGSVQLTLAAKAVKYDKFEGADLSANVALLNSEARVNNVSMKHANGTVSMKGSLQEGSTTNALNMRAELKNIHLPVIFNAFSDFGQDALSHKNIEGKITAVVQMSTELTDQAKILRERNKGTIDFLIQDFELNDFEPIQKIAQKVFKKQDFTKIKFADLKNQLVIDGSAFRFERMEIRSTAITMFVRGVYDVKNGTDMRIVLPVRNLLGNNADTDLSEEGKSKRGVSIRLRAQTGDDGKLKVGWDPLRRGGKTE